MNEKYYLPPKTIAGVRDVGTAAMANEDFEGDFRTVFVTAFGSAQDCFGELWSPLLDC